MIREGWEPITDGRKNGKADQTFYPAANGRFAISEEAGLRSFEAAQRITPADIVALGNQFVDGSGLYSPLRLNTKTELENGLKVLKGMTKLRETAKQEPSMQLLTTIFTFISDNHLARPNLIPKLDQILEFLKVKKVAVE